MEIDREERGGYQYLMTSSSLKSWCREGRSLSCAARRRRRRVLMVPSWRMIGFAIALVVCLFYFLFCWALKSLQFVGASTTGAILIAVLFWT